MHSAGPRQLQVSALSFASFPRVDPAQPGVRPLPARTNAATTSSGNQPKEETCEGAREAGRLFREYLQLHSRSTGTNDWPTANVKSYLGFALTIAATDATLLPAGT